VSRDDSVPAVNQDWIGEAKYADALGNLPNLVFAMGPGIVRVRLEPRDRLVGDGPLFEMHGFALLSLQRIPEKCSTIV
jgi:hypothetical protein